MPKISNRQRIGLEKMLRSEEKIIVEKLTEIKEQRNCLAIERLEIESLLAASINKVLGNQETAPKPTEVVEEPSTSETLSTSFAALSTYSEALSTSPGASKQEAPPEKHTVVTTMSQSGIPVAGIDDTMCNFEKLDLSLTPSLIIPAKEQIAAYETEEGEEDSQQSADKKERKKKCLFITK